jgi:hypothetical protein
MPSFVERILDSETVQAALELTAAAWARLGSFANDTARSGPVLDVIGIALCTLIIAYLIYNRVKYRRFLLDERLVNPLRADFSAEVIARMIGQQTEKSFAALVRAIYDERERLQQWAEESLLPAGETLFVSRQSGDENLPLQAGSPAAASTENTGSEMARLAAAGMGAAEIAAVVKKSQAEVELYLSLDRRRVVNGDDVDRENIAPHGKNFRLISGRRVDSTV